MKARWKLSIIAVLLVAISGASLAILLLTREPVYGGKTVSQYRRGTVQLLTRLGANAKEAISALRELSSDVNADAVLRENARKAIEVIDSEAAAQLRSRDDR